MYIYTRLHFIHNILYIIISLIFICDTTFEILEICFIDEPTDMEKILVYILNRMFWKTSYFRLENLLITYKSICRTCVCLYTHVAVISRWIKDGCKYCLINVKAYSTDQQQPISISLSFTWWWWSPAIECVSTLQKEYTITYVCMCIFFPCTHTCNIEYNKKYIP